MEILFVILIWGGALFFMVRYLKKSIKGEGSECHDCGSKDPCSKKKCS